MVTAFTNEQYESVYPEGIQHHYWNVARTQIIINALKKNGCTGKRILEIGCGKGVVLKILRSKGVECYGCELAPLAISEEYIQYNTDFTALDKEFIATIEVVLLLDVIEHIEDDKDFLTRIYDTFPNLTHIIMTVPARKELWSSFDHFCGHFRRYTIHTLCGVCKDAGFSMKSIGYFFHVLYIPIRLFSYLNITRNNEFYAPRKNARFVHYIVGVLFFLEYLFLPAKLRGSSIIAVGIVQHV